MMIEIKTSYDSMELLSADEVFIKLCLEMAKDLVKEKRETFVFEIKIDLSKMRRMCNKIVNSKIMQRLRKIVIKIIEGVFVKLMVEIILSLINAYKAMCKKKQFALIY